MTTSGAGHRSSNLSLGAAQMIGAAFFFALMATGVQVASEGLPSAMVVFFRNAVALVLVAPIALSAGLQAIKTQRLGEHALRTIAGLASMYCFFYAIAHLRLAEAVLLQYTLPLFVPLVEAAWLREKMPRRLWWPIWFGFAGVLLVLKPGMGLFRGAALVGLAAGLLSAVAQTGVRRMTSTEPTSRIIFYFSLLSTLTSAVPAGFAWVTPAAPTMLVLVLVGAAAATAQMLMTRAYSCAPASQVGAFTYVNIPFAILFDWIRLSRLPDRWSVAGAILICGAGVFMLRLGKGARATAAATSFQDPAP
ncbi:MAG TPA: DMT family transporter [Polyangia bacterium]